jgi:hypothetical protein
MLYYSYYIMVTIDSIINAGLARKAKNYKFSDTLKFVVGKESYGNIADSLYDRFYTKKVEKGEKPSRMYFLLKEYNQKSYYSWAIDAVAQNIASLPFIFNDRYAPLKYIFQALFNYQPPPDNDWSTALATRLTAFGGNAAIGDFYRVWQDYLDSYLGQKWNVHNENNMLKKNMKNAAIYTVAFVTGQAPMYAVFLYGGNMFTGKETNIETLAMGVISLSLFAPVIGPWTSKVYKKLRTVCDLPPQTEFK